MRLPTSAFTQHRGRIFQKFNSNKRGCLEALPNRPGKLPPFLLLSRPLRCFALGCAASAAPLAPAGAAPLLTAPAGAASTAKDRDQDQG